ncbi:hypothetical protein [Mesorhizobium sp. f-mel]
MSDLLNPRLSNFAQLVRIPERLKLPPLLSPLDLEGDDYTFELPYRQLSVFARRYENSEALASMPVYAIASLGDLDAVPTPVPPTEENPDPDSIPVPVVHRPLGLLGTDHVGYASFDLDVLRTQDTIGALRAAKILKPGVETRIGLRNLWVFPFADPVLIVDALRDGDIGPNVIALRIELDNARLADRELNHPMASMQNPNILDWRLSPGSFTLSGALLVGADGCESLLPSNLSTQRFRFSQVARVPRAQWSMTHETREESEDREGRSITVSIWTERYRLGRIFEYTTEWFQIGHSLGPLVYSLPLAPGEIVKVAVLDWSRSDAGTRDEQTSLSETLQHDQLRDRSLTESVHAVLEEWQRGGSVMGGAAGSGAFGAGNMGIGGAASLGGAYTTSSGSRDLTAETAQRISDSFHQATSALRELRSTVVVQTEQAESSSAQTRTVANYNHSHALTILYYEVLRHYRVVTRLARNQPALLIDYTPYRFNFKDEGQLLAFRRELEAILLDSRLIGCFDALGRVMAGRAAFEAAKKAPKPSAPGDVWFDRFTITISTGGDGGGGTDGDPYVDFYLTDGTGIWSHQIEPNDSSNPRHLGHPGYDDFEDGDVDSYGLKPLQPIQWNKLRGFVIGLDGGGDWRINHVKLEGFTLVGDRIQLYDAGYGKDLPDDTKTTEFLTAKPPPGPPAPVIEAFVNAADLQTVDLLTRHLEAHRHYYQRVLWLLEDPNARAARFEALALNGVPVLDIIENRAVEISGDWVAFPIAVAAEGQVHRAMEFRDEPVPDPTDTFVEQLLTLPSRGVFAEAKLGNCNASELIDNDRFWDWQKSPIPHQAPDILPVDTGSRAATVPGLTPTEFPNSLVNIVNPGALPDPTGLASAMKVLGTPGIFRDMSAAEELGSLLEKLSDNATSLASEGLKSGKRQDLLREIRAADELSAAKKAGLIEDLFKKEIGVQPKAPAANGSNSGGQPSGGSGTTSGSSSASGGGPSQVAPETTAGTGGSTVPTVEPPKPKPSNPSKPKLPTPTPPSRGLGFHLNFQRAQVSTTAVGTANVTVRASGPGGGVLPGSGGYIPGVTTGAPTAEQAKALPETWTEQPFTDGGLVLRSAHTTGGGQISITAVYKIPIVNKENLISGVQLASDALHIVNYEQGTLTCHNSVSYAAPAQGDIVRLKVTPHVVPVIITFGSSKEFQEELASKVGGNAIVTAEISGSMTSGSGSSTSRTITLAYLTGGLSIVPE